MQVRTRLWHHDVAKSTLSAVVGVATGLLIARKRKRRRPARQIDTQPDDVAWHAALHSTHPPVAG